MVPPPAGGAFIGAPEDPCICIVIGPKLGLDDTDPIIGEVVTAILLGRVMLWVFRALGPPLLDIVCPVKVCTVEVPPVLVTVSDTVNGPVPAVLTVPLEPAEHVPPEVLGYANATVAEVTVSVHPSPKFQV
jgi:hypothetical protein